MTRSPDAVDVVRDYWSRVWSAGGDAAAVRELYAGDAQLNGEPVDLEDFAGGVERWFVTFPDFQTTVDDVIVADDRVVTRVTYAGSHQGTWAGLPATGRAFSVVGLDVFRVADGRIVEHWHSVDHYEMVVGLGGEVVPTKP